LFYKETANITLSSTSTTARFFSSSGGSYNKLTIGGTSGISTLTVSGENTWTEWASTKTVAHTIDFESIQTIGKWSITGTSGNVVTLGGSVPTGHVIAGSATTSINFLSMGSFALADTSPGEFYAGVNSTGTAGAPVYRTATPAARTLYWVGGTGNWSDTSRWSTSSGGKTLSVSSARARDGSFIFATSGSFMEERKRDEFSVNAVLVRGFPS
jgi:hypothetical protein